MNRTWNLKLFLSISLGLHVSALALLSFLMPDLKITPLPRLDFEVSFLPLAREEQKSPQKVEKKVTVRSLDLGVRSKEMETKIAPPEPVKIYEENKVVQTEKVEVTLPKKQEEPVATPPVQSQPKVISVNDPKPSPLQSGNKQVESKQEERIVIASLGNPIPLVSSSEKPLTTIPPKADPPRAERSPSFSESGIIFAQPRYGENPKPLYPQEAKKKGYEGEVLLRVEVLSSGQVGEIEVRRSSGHEVLDRSAIKTVKQWKFIPAKKGETPVPVWVNIPIAFQLQ